MGRSAPTIDGISADELDGFLAAFALTFGHTHDPEAVERRHRYVETERAVVARAGGAIVATSGAYTFELTLPGGTRAGCAGITLVSVRPDHRRRGLLSRMLRTLLDQAGARGEPFAALWASESAIYGRFGFGPAVPTLQLELDRVHGRFRTPAPAVDVDLVDADTAAARFPGIYDTARAFRPGLLRRTTDWWEARELDDRPADRHGAGEKRFALLGDRGYAIHRLRPGWAEGVPDGTLEVLDLVALDPEANRALWGFLVDTDLAATIQAGRRPVDEPLLGMLVDPLRARARAGWPLYVRLVDVPAALTARRYAVDDTFVLEVQDRFRPANEGRWRLDVRDGEATCERTDAAADLRLDVEDLATVALGGVRATALTAAGRIVPRTWEVVPRFDRLLAADLPPWQGFVF